jgi:hypothetical protein
VLGALLVSFAASLSAEQELFDWVEAHGGLVRDLEVNPHLLSNEG